MIVGTTATTVGKAKVVTNNHQIDVHITKTATIVRIADTTLKAIEVGTAAEDTMKTIIPGNSNLTLTVLVVGDKTNP